MLGTISNKSESQSSESKRIDIRTEFAGILLVAVLLFAIFMLNSNTASAALSMDVTDSYGNSSSASMGGNTAASITNMSAMPKMRSMTDAQRRAAAARVAEARAQLANTPAAKPAKSGTMSAASISIMAMPLPNETTDYFGMYSNFANSPIPAIDPASGVISGGIRKFVDSLPGLTSAGANNLGKYIPVAVADTATYNGSDYYEIALVEYSEKMHSDLPPTKLRGYVQLETPVISGNHVALYYPDGITPIINAEGNQVFAVDSPRYLGPLVIAQKDRAVRIKFTNYLPTGAGGDLFLPTDPSIMGAGMGPLGTNGTSMNLNYAENRATLHLHGGNTPWISDGTQHQWTTPAGEDTPYTNGVSVKNVPDMDNGTEPQGTLTFYYTNQQSARLMFYHDHAYGITRLNVYAGEAAGYLLTDQVEQDLIGGTNVSGANPGLAAVLPDVGIPLIIQDKTFVWGAPADIGMGTNATGTYATDPTWIWGGSGSLWLPHVYMPNQNPSDVGGANAMGRWDYGPWFWPVFTTVNGPVPNPYYNPDTAPWEPPMSPGLPNPSIVPEAFMDTPVVNGNAYPYLEVDPKTYRFRILNAGNDRMLNLQLYVADPTISQFDSVTGAPNPGYLKEVKMVPAALNPAIPFPEAWKFQTPGMIPDILDGRPGGVPDPAYIGPTMIQIGTEGGFLPAPVVHPNIPVGYEQNKRNIVVGSVSEKNLFLGPAERADVIVDFSQFAGKTIILYNDAPAPVPAGDPRNDYYTGDMDNTATGGAPTTLAGYGPNTRTIMQIRVANTTSAAAYNLSALQAALPAAYAGFQDKPLVPQAGYNSAFNASYPSNTFASISSNNMTFLPAASSQPVRSVAVTAGGSGYVSAPNITFTGGGGANAAAVAAINATGFVIGITITDGGSGYTSAPFVNITGGNGTGAAANAILSLTMALRPKAIHELFDPNYGRMNSLLGVEVPFTNALTQTTIPYTDIDPPTELFLNSNASAPLGTLEDGTQLWKITHNGVDTHALHWHMFNVQVINRVGWDGAVRMPDPNELGWKDTVRMNPLEDIIVAMRPITPNIPFDIPNSIRPIDVTAPPGTTGQFGASSNFILADPYNIRITAINHLINYGWEYVWHCHLLGHEENIMMRSMLVATAPKAPFNLTAASIAPGMVLVTWVDNSTSETSFIVQRSSDNITWATLSTRASATGPATGDLIPYLDATAASAATYYYRVLATNLVGDTTMYTAPAIGFPSMSVNSAPSDTVAVTTA